MTVDSEERPVPPWLLTPQLAMCPCGCIGKRKKGSFVEKTLTGSADVLRQAMFSEDMAARHGLLQRVDARLKAAGLLVMLVGTALLHHVPMILAMYTLTLALATASALPLGFFVKRVWLFVPIFTGIIVLPATLSLITPGDVVWTWWTRDGSPVGVTTQGLTSAGLIVTRVATSVSLVVLLTLTTPWVTLLGALRGLGVPRMFVLIIGMAYRYVFLLLSTVTDMYEARKARSVGAVTHDRSARAFVGASAGTMVTKAHHLSEEVYQAMVARGYRGDATTLAGFKVKTLDLVFLAAAIVTVVVVYGGDRALGR